jgi:hypothetical protein
MYGSVLWDLGNLSIKFICRTWQKGLRRALGLPIDASYKLLSGLSGTLLIMDELRRLDPCKGQAAYLQPFPGPFCRRHCPLPSIPYSHESLN